MGLTPGQIDNAADRASEAFSSLEDTILQDIARRIAKANYATDTARWQAERASALGASTRYLLQRMQTMSTTVGPQVARIFAEAMLQSDIDERTRYTAAGLEYTPLGSSAAAQQLVNSGFRRTMNTLVNLTQTRALMGNRNMPQTVQAQLGQILDAAHMQATSGAFSSDEVVRKGLRTLADEGLGAITYPSGHIDKLEVVVRRALVTGINQTAGDISLHNAGEMGVDIMELSAHGGARTGDGGDDYTNHSWWQGKLVSRSGKAGFLSLTDIGYGDVQGFQGANCRHTWFPFFPGLSVRNWDDAKLAELMRPKFSYNGKLLTETQCDERQRALERRIRGDKRTWLIMQYSSDPQDAVDAAARLKQDRSALSDFLRQTGRQQQQLRETVPGFGRSEASRASAQARRMQ
jgi:hypothetical protein